MLLRREEFKIRQCSKTSPHHHQIIKVVPYAKLPFLLALHRQNTITNALRLLPSMISFANNCRHGIILITNRPKRKHRRFNGLSSTFTKNKLVAKGIFFMRFYIYLKLYVQVPVQNTEPHHYCRNAIHS